MGPFYYKCPQHFSDSARLIELYQSIKIGHNGNVSVIAPDKLCILSS